MLYIFDVDGTLRWTHTPGRRYPLSTDDWSLMPNVAQKLRTIQWSTQGPHLALVSNQSGVGEGLLSSDQARQMIVATVHAAIGYMPEHTLIEICTCRDGAACRRHKPNPGMLLAALQQFDVCASEARYVGDQPIDAEAAHRAGIPFIWANAFFEAGTS